MNIIEDIADELAVKALELELRSGDEAIIKKMGEVLASSSPTMEERFLTAVRIRRGQKRAMEMLAEFEAGLDGAPAPEDTPEDAPDAPLALPSSDDDVSIDVD